MTPTANNTPKYRKRKGPPSFQHLPAERAKKLKRDWVEKKKIKSLWRRQKQEQGFGMQAGGNHLEEERIHSTEKRGEESSNEMEVEHTTSPGTRALAEHPSGPKGRTKLRSLPSSHMEKSRRMSDQSSRTNHDRLRSRPHPGEQPGRREKGSIGGKGRQPNMRLKMGRLLEKIKQDYTSG
ncbi:hypothetical protein JB92DRAFT_3037485 [Gautieria morchelliformis]|nr:hypothetical protein JB92DRAFT_3037485 [Gautieria morchelliformis]